MFVRTLFRAGLGVLLLCATSAPAWAQATPTAPPPPPTAEAAEPRFTLMGGYAYFKDNAWDEHMFFGFQATLGYRITKNMSIVGEFGGSHGEKGTTGFTIQRYALLGGIKLSGGEDRLRPFFHVLTGVSRQGGDVGQADGIVVQPGGGVDFQLNDKIALRGQGDFRWWREDDTNYTGYRFSGGLVFYLDRLFK